MTEYRLASNKQQLVTRTKNTIRRAFGAFNRGQDTRFLDSLPRLQDMNSLIYACAYLTILDNLQEEPASIRKTELFSTLLNELKIGEDDERRTLLALFQVYVMIVMIRLHVPESELLLKEGQVRRYSEEEDDNLVYGGYA